ncbi:hypothetical protein FHX41_2172 [Actinomadura hallensis]|uniref:Toxin-antitoxin system HicB family antitoxin n=1 Tax=Actinomadura hallensis TaxID=337895 RepID=A0A543ID60_9ACTN|nr:hypothetical protein FHX41_2172 [Actinomadura hallensis]HLV73892.1 hypothetical protein [Vulgatibacteraceae bacterium]
MTERKKVLLRLDPAVHDALVRWAADELRSTNAQIEFLLRRALADAGRMPRSARAMRGRGRPRKESRAAGDDTADEETAGANTTDGDTTADDTARPGGSTLEKSTDDAEDAGAAEDGPRDGNGE